MRIPKTTSSSSNKDKYYNGFQEVTAEADGTIKEYGGPTPETVDFTSNFENTINNFRGDKSGVDTVVLENGTEINKVSLDVSDKQTISLKNTFISSKVNNQDKNNSNKTFGESLLDAYTGVGNGILKQVTGGYGAEDFKNAGEMAAKAKDGEGFLGFMAGLSGANGEINNLSLSMSNLEDGKDKNFKEFHTDDWRDGDLLNNPANVAGTMQQDLRGTLGASNFTFDRDGSSNGTWLGVLNAAGSSAISSLGLDGLANSIMNLADKDRTSDAEDAAQLIELNTATKDTIYTSKPGNYVKIRSLNMMGADNSSYNSMISVQLAPDGDQSNPLNFLNYIRGNNFRKLQKENIIKTKDDIEKASTFRKKMAIYSKEMSFPSPYTQTSNAILQIYEKSNDFFTSSGFSTLSEEEIRLITLIKNKNTYNKKLGYIYIKPFWKYFSDGITDGSDLQIPFEFNPEISEGAVQANYATETLINRLGQYHVYTGTNLSTLNIQLTYQALAPDTLSAEDNNALGKAYGTDAWMYYWTNNRIEEIELKLRSLVFPDMVNGGGNIIKPPIIEVHLENGLGENVETVGDLYKYPSSNGESSTVGSNYLSISRILNGGTVQRYKKYIVNSVQIDKIDDASVEYPSYYGRMYNGQYKSYNPMYHVAQTSATKGWSGYSRRRSFKATLQCTEITENFIDLVPDFNAYYKAWNGKAVAANDMNNYVESATGTGVNNFKSVQDILNGNLYSLTKGLASLEDQLVSYFEEARVIAKLYNRANSDKNSSIYKLNNNLGVYENLSEEGKENIKKITIDNSESSSEVKVDINNTPDIFCKIKVPSGGKFSSSDFDKQAMCSDLDKYKLDDVTLDKYLLYEYDGADFGKVSKNDIGVSKMFKHDESQGVEKSIALTEDKIDNESIYDYISPMIATIMQLKANTEILDDKITEIDGKYEDALSFFNDSEVGGKYNFEGVNGDIKSALFEGINAAGKKISENTKEDSGGVFAKYKEMASSIINEQEKIKKVYTFIADHSFRADPDNNKPNWFESNNVKITTTTNIPNDNIAEKYFDAIKAAIERSSTTQGIAIAWKGEPENSDVDIERFLPPAIIKGEKYFNNFNENIKTQCSTFLKELNAMNTDLSKLLKAKDFKANGGTRIPEVTELVNSLSGENGLIKSFSNKFKEMDSAEMKEKIKNLDLCIQVIKENFELLTVKDKLVKQLLETHSSIYISAKKANMANIASLVSGNVSLYGVKSSTKNVTVSYYNKNFEKVSKNVQFDKQQIKAYAPNKLGIIPLSIYVILNKVIDLYSENLKFAKNVLNECTDVVSSGLSKKYIQDLEISWNSAAYGHTGAGSGYSGSELHELVKTIADNTDSTLKQTGFDIFMNGLNLDNLKNVNKELMNSISNVNIGPEITKEKKQLIDIECSGVIKQLYAFYSKDGLQKQFSRIAGYNDDEHGDSKVSNLEALENQAELYSSPNGATFLEAYGLYTKVFESWVSSDDFKTKKEFFNSDINGIIPYMFKKVEDNQNIAKSLHVAGSVSDIEIAKKLGGI